MNRLYGIIYHTLRGSEGWSRCKLKSLDVAKIIDMQTHRRAFMLFDTDKPYTLTISYYHPVEPGEIIKHITRRYTDINTVNTEVEEMSKKIVILEAYQQKIATRLLKRESTI